MMITYVCPDGFKKKVNKGFNYFLPSDAKIIVSDCEYITINGRQRILDGNSYKIDYSGTDLDLEHNGNKYYIRTYGQKLEDNTRYEYVKFSETLTQIIEKEQGNISAEKFVDILNHNEYDLSLCTFNRNVEEMRKDKSLEDILRYIKQLKQVFERPKTHLREEMELLPVEVVTRISHETIRHLASHSENCEARHINGLVPSRLLAKNLEEDWAIYENVVAKNLVDRMFKYVKKYNRDILIAEQGNNFSLSLNNEERNVYVAQDILYKGFVSNNADSGNEKTKEDDRILFSKLDQQCKEIEKAIIYCRESKLYRILKKCKKVYSPLKTTNIFMMDRKYQAVYELWKILDRAEFSTEKVAIPNDIKNEYWDFSHSLLNFAFNNFNFTPDTDIIVKENTMQNISYSFKEWTVHLRKVRIEKLSSFGIGLDFSLKQNYVMPFNTENACECVGMDISVADNEIVFNKIPSDEEITMISSAMFPKRHGHDSIAQLKRRELRQATQDFFRGKKEKKISVLLLPFPVSVPQTEVELGLMTKNLSNDLKDCMDEFKCCYILLPQRLSDIENLSNKEWSRKLISYPETQTGEKFGVIPITLGDIDSYRRFTKIIMRHMIDVDDAHSTCPICGGAFVYINGTWECDNPKCATSFSIRKPRCSCGKEYIVTHYKKSHSFSEHTYSELANRYELLEIKGGFKNYTAIDEKLNPVCPYCRNDRN